jgi:hypothetical protein
MPDDRPIDGISLLPLLRGDISERPVPIPYRFLDGKKSMFDSPTIALTDNQYKYLTNLSNDGDEDLLFDLHADMFETTNVISDHPDRVRDMKNHITEFMASCRKSHFGADYKEPYQPINEFQEITGTWLE